MSKEDLKFTVYVMLLTLFLVAFFLWSIRPMDYRLIVDMVVDKKIGPRLKKLENHHHEGFVKDLKTHWHKGHKRKVIFE